MCWETYLLPVKRKAKRNIYVFKICTKVNNSSKGAKPYYFPSNMVYEEGKTYISKELSYYRSENSIFSINKGFHSYSVDNTIEKYWSRGVRVSHLLWGLLGGKVLDAYWKPYLCLVLCVIPKGAEYYLNEKEEYVSNKLTVKRIIYPITPDINGKFEEAKSELSKWRDKEIKIYNYVLEK